MSVFWPNGSTRIPYVTSEFGPRAPIPGVSTSGFHSGIDLIGWVNNKSPVNGVVIFAQYNGGGGNEIRIRADNGDVFRILHNARFLVSVGQRVGKGQDVGVMGTTGASTGVHCHFQTHPGGGDAVNPRGYMAQANTGTAGDGDYIDITPERIDNMGKLIPGVFKIVNGGLSGVHVNLSEDYCYVYRANETEGARLIVAPYLNDGNSGGALKGLDGVTPLADGELIPISTDNFLPLYNVLGFPAGKLVQVATSGGGGFARTESVSAGAIDPAALAAALAPLLSGVTDAELEAALGRLTLGLKP